MKLSKSFFGFLFAIALCLWITPQALAGVGGKVTIKNYRGKELKSLSKGNFLSNGDKIFVEHLLDPSLTPKKTISAQKSTAKRRNSKQAAKTEENKTAVKKNKKTERPPVKKGFYVDNSTNQATVLLHLHKKYMNLDLNQNRSWEQKFWRRFFMQGGISLDPKKVEKKGFQFKALKKEKIEGYLCSVWEIKGVGANADVYGTVWAADELGKIPLKIQLQYQGDYSAEFLLTDIKNTEVNVATFFPPQGYTAYEPKIVTGSTSEAFPQDKQTEAINKAVKNRQKQN